MRRFLRDTNGATAIEYALLVAVLGVALIGSSEQVSTAIVNQFTCLAESIGVGSGMC